MVGNIVHRSMAEPIFRERLKQLGDEELAGAARTWIWQERPHSTLTTKTSGATSASNKNANDAETPTSTSTRRTTSWRNCEKTVAAKTPSRRKR